MGKTSALISIVLLIYNGIIYCSIVDSSRLSVVFPFGPQVVWRGIFIMFKSESSTHIVSVWFGYKFGDKINGMAILATFSFRSGSLLNTPNGNPGVGGREKQLR